MLYNEVTKKSMDVKGGIVIMNIKRILTGVLAGAFLTTMTAFSAAAAITGSWRSDKSLLRIFSFISAAAAFVKVITRKDQQVQKE